MASKTDLYMDSIGEDSLAPSLSVSVVSASLSTSFIGSIKDNTDDIVSSPVFSVTSSNDFIVRGLRVEEQDSSTVTSSNDFIVSGGSVEMVNEFVRLVRAFIRGSSITS